MYSLSTHFYFRPLEGGTQPLENALPSTAPRRKSGAHQVGFMTSGHQLLASCLWEARIDLVIH